MSMYKHAFKASLNRAETAPPPSGLPAARSLEMIENIIRDNAATAEERVRRVREFLR